MTSRLDRLFILLESGTSAAIRRAAAKQIGEVQKLYPHELHNLLNRLITYLYHSSWETRVTAAQAVEAILSYVPQWNPKLSPIKTECPLIVDEAQLTFDKFDLAQVLQKGARLMGSEGSEFDFHDDKDENSERLSRQRALLNEKLGFNQASKLGIDVNDLVTLDDMVNESTYNINKQMVPVQDILNLEMKNTSATSLVNLSSREMNRVRRKARQNNAGVAGNSTTNASNNSSKNDAPSIEEPEKKKTKLDDIKKPDIFYNLNEPVPDTTGSWGDAVSWPLQQFCSQLFLDMFNARWETRHGAATALRVLINTHSSSAGKCVNMTEDEMKLSHYKWLEDAALKLLCVLSLDRFGDFLSDQVVAPVRETCAQVLGTLIKEMESDQVHQIVKILLSLHKQKEWEVRHGGLLGLKYVFVVRQELLQIFLPLTINDILMGLFDSVDDVGAVAASTLVPVASWFPKLLNIHQVSSIVKMLWDLLLDQDELTSACNSFMELLAAILSLPNASQWLQMEPMSVLIPRLWPFLCHSTSSVRRSTLITLKTLTSKVSEETISNNTNNGNENGSNGKQNETINIENINFDSKKLELNFGVKHWQPILLQEALRHIYQRVLIEPLPDIQDLAVQVWANLVNYADLSALLHAACPFVATWICLAMQPTRLAFDPANLIFAKTSHVRERKARANLDLGSNSQLQQEVFLGGTESIPLELREKNVMRARVTACKMLGILSHYLVQPAPSVVYTPDVESPTQCYTKILIGYLQSRSSLQRFICALIIGFWALTDSSIRPGPKVLQDRLNYCVMEHIYYDEVAVSFTRLLQESKDFIATLKQYKVPMTDFDNNQILTLDQIQLLATTLTENLKEKYPLKPKVLNLLEERRRSLQNSFQQTNAEQNCHNISTQAALAGSIVCLQCLPEKLNPVIKPLMESIKREECELLQQITADYLVQLLDNVSKRTPNPNNKIVTNLCTLLKNDYEYTPKIEYPEQHIKDFKPNESNGNPYYGILALNRSQKGDFSQNKTNYRGPGRPPRIEVTVEDSIEVNDTVNKQNRIQRIGATFVITSICKYFGIELHTKIPTIKKIMFENIEKFLEIDQSVENIRNIQLNQERTNDLVTSLQLIEIASPHIHNELHDDFFSLLPKLCNLATHQLKAVRHMASRCIATFATIDDSKVMDSIMKLIIPCLQKIERVIERQGAVEAINLVIEKLQIKIVPYVVLFVVPILGRMSDPDECVRLMSTRCFATIIQIMPCDAYQSNISNLSRDLQNQKAKDREFLEFLFNPKGIPPYKVPVSINAELREYQQAGVNWLWFLNRYNLHGILCDDMGLGKTLQTICILAGDHHQRLEEKLTHLPSIIVCPSTLTGHWIYEINKFLPNNILNPLYYIGKLPTRKKIHNKLNSHNLLVVSYDALRKDIDFFGAIHWNYCVLDEGHIIRNGKTKNSKAVKQLKAVHRLILSGTPIQNNVLELWSLFDFLMPGFLGTEKQFAIRYSRPILASRDPKNSSKEQEAGVLAMEALHRQVLPFLLRRVKEDVLKDLPPKITQDLLCELSPIQERLYDDFSNKHLKDGIQNGIDNFSKESFKENTHIFCALRYLQQVCNHPKLVLNEQHPEYEKIQQELAAENKTLDDIEHSAKLLALKQLLLDCGIGLDNTELAISQHRALIFCKFKVMLDIVENDLLKKHLPAVSFLRLDRTVPINARQDIVMKFNSDPSIDVLLLTTSIGGVGLNLTGADTVIFVEHDWNPMRDMQAMDRAHRIGQKKVVNVYRLITRKSVEEKIVGLQKFKTLTANMVVSAENSSMDTMATDQLFNLFSLSDEDSKKQSATPSSNSGNVSIKNIINNLPDLWEEQQYEEEYDISQFIQNLKK